MSSVVAGLERVRDAVDRGATKSGYFVVRSEEAAASPVSPRRALLDEVREADIFVLILGPQYGTKTDSGKSATEDEYDEAVRHGKQVIVLVQDAELDVDQSAFLARVRGAWGDGLLSASFSDEADAALEIAAALSKLKSGIQEDGPEAESCALELVSTQPSHSSYSTPRAAIAFVPLRNTEILAPAALQAAALQSDLEAAFRISGLVPQSLGITSSVGSQGFRLETTAGEMGQREVSISPRGSVVVDAPVDKKSGLGGFSSLSPSALKAFMASAGRLAQDIWDLIDSVGEVGNVAVALAVYGTSFTNFGEVPQSSVSMSVPQHIVAGNKAWTVARGEASGDRLSEDLVAAIRLVFLDAGAVGI